MRVELTDKAKKQIAKLPKKEQKKIIKKLIVIGTYPFSGKALSGELSAQYSFRAWPYRIFYLIDKKNKQVLVFNIEHRQRAYK